MLKKIIAKLSGALIWVVLICTGCTTGDKTSGDGLKYNGLQAFGLQGPVKMVKNETDGFTTVFDKAGNIESVISGDMNVQTTNVYESPSRFKKGDIQYRIDINGNVMRIINEADEDIFEFEDEYEFDTQGRVIKHVWHEGMMGVTLVYDYQGDSRLPYKETQSSFDEMGDWSVSIEYEYVDVDKHGNWTKRVGTVHTVSNDYEDEQRADGSWDYNSKTTTSETIDTVEELRTITYY